MAATVGDGISRPAVVGGWMSSCGGLEDMWPVRWTSAVAAYTNGRLARGWLFLPNNRCFLHNAVFIVGKRYWAASVQ